MARGPIPHRAGRLDWRMTHFTWAWFSTNMATGSMAVLLYQTPHKFRGLITIGKVVFLIDLVLFCAFSLMIAIRFTLRPKAFPKSLHDPVESFFFGTFWVSISLLLQNISQYGYPYCGPWLVKALEVCFWCYCAAILMVAIFQYYTLFVTENLQISSMVPAWILPIYPLLVAGPLAGGLLEHQPIIAGISIWVAGVTCQGSGWMVATFMYVLWTFRLLSYDLPAPSMRPGMYIAVGPTGRCSIIIRAFLATMLTNQAIPSRLSSSLGAEPPRSCLPISWELLRYLRVKSSSWSVVPLASSSGY